MSERVQVVTRAADAGAAFGAPRRRSLVPATALQWAIWIVVVALVLGPFLPPLYASFRDRPLYESGGVFTVRPYLDLFRDSGFWHAWANTLEYATLTTLMAVIAGGAMAVLVSRTDLPLRRVLGRAAVLSLLLPPLGMILGWIVVWGPGGYLTNLFSQRLGVGTIPITTIPGMALIEASRLLPISLLTCQAALDRTDSSLEDAARSAGARPVRVLFSVTLPMLRPALLNSATLIFTLSIASLAIPLLLGPTRDIRFVSSYLYLTWTNSAQPDPGSVSAGAMLLFVVATLLLVLRNRLIGAEARFVSVGGRSARRQLVPLGAWRWPLFSLLALYLIFAIVIPALGLALMSVVVVLTPLVAPWHLLTWANWQTLGGGEFRGAIEHSIVISTIGAAVTVALVAVATLVAHRSGFKLRRSLPFVMLYPQATPGIIIGIGFFWAYLVTGAFGNFLRSSIWGIMVAFCVRSLPFAYVVMYPALTRVSEELDQAARTVGAGWWSANRRIVLPLLRPALFAAFVLMFVELLNDYDPALFLVRPGTEVIGTTMLIQFLKDIPGPVAALAMVQLAITVVGLAIGARLFKIGSRGSHDA